MKRITILTLGSRGDVQPCLALAVGLQNVGYQVTIATHGQYAAWIESYGVQAVPLAGDATVLMRGLVAAGNDGIAYLRHWRRFFVPLLQEALDTLLEACRTADLVISGTFGMPIFFAAERLNIPAVRISFQPFDRTAAFPAPMTPPQISLGGHYNRLTQAVVEQIAHQTFRRELNAWRGQHGLAPMPRFRWPHNRLGNRPVPVLYGFSPTIVPRPSDWHTHIHITGYWFLPANTDWRPPETLSEFLAAGPPPLCISFGSMLGASFDTLLDRLMRLLVERGQRTILLSGWGDGRPQHSPTQFAIDAVPHDWLFPRVAGVVHHGGAGTTAAALRAGVPSLVIPFFGDQPFWADRLVKIGAGLSLTQRQSRSSKLDDAVDSLLHSKELRQTAHEVGVTIRSENGIDQAVAHIVELLGF